MKRQKAESCRCCHGTGQVMRLFFDGEVATPRKMKCYQCDGKGWINFGRMIRNARRAKVA